MGRTRGRAAFGQSRPTIIVHARRSRLAVPCHASPSRENLYTVCVGSPGVLLQRALEAVRMGASGGSEEQNPEGDGNSGGPANVLIAALAGTTALFGAVTVTLVVAVILLYIRHSRRMKRNRSDVKEEKSK